MGEYFSWVNVDKKEFLCPNDFDLGNKCLESSWEDNHLLRALRELLAAEWKGCRIVFLGDECNAPENNTIEILELIQKHSEEIDCSGNLYDTVAESYRNVSCQFKDAEADVRSEIGFYLQCLKDGGFIPPNEYRIDVNDPFNGLFQRKGKSFKYTINLTKNICYSLDETTVLDHNGRNPQHFDPLPVLMSYGRRKVYGEWLGDIIAVSDDIPVGCTLLKEIKLEWP